MTRWDEVPMPMTAPTVHNPALVLDWMRFASDTCVAFVRMQADLLRELTPGIPVTTNLRALSRHYDHFDMAEVLDFVSLDGYATLQATEPSENAVELDIMRSLKKRESARRTATRGSGSSRRRPGTSTGRRSTRCSGRGWSGCSPTSWSPAGRPGSSISSGARRGSGPRSSTAEF